MSSHLTYTQSVLFTSLLLKHEHGSCLAILFILKQLFIDLINYCLVFIYSIANLYFSHIIHLKIVIYQFIKLLLCFICCQSIFKKKLPITINNTVQTISTYLNKTSMVLVRNCEHTCWSSQFVDFHQHMKKHILQINIGIDI